MTPTEDTPTPDGRIKNGFGVGIDVTQQQDVKQLDNYDYLANLEHDYGFSAKEMQGIRRAQLQLVSELEGKAEQQQIVVAYEKTYEHKPILQDWKAVPLEVLEHKKQELERGKR